MPSAALEGPLLLVWSTKCRKSLSESFESAERTIWWPQPQLLLSAQPLRGGTVHARQVPPQHSVSGINRFTEDGEGRRSALVHALKGFHGEEDPINVSLNSSVRLLVEAEGAEEVKLLMFVHRSENILFNDFGILGWHIDESELIAL